jgi:hypothetical protein
VPNTGGPTFPIERRATGLYLPQLDLHLDPEGDAPQAFASDAHARHLGTVGRLLASHETRTLLQARGQDVSNVTPLDWSTAMECRMADGGGTARLSIEPAGHVLGAAQLVVDHPRGRFVYTGDYRTGPGRTHAPGAAIPCDELLIESTFALPIFRFPPRAIVMDRVVYFCREALEEGHTPALLVPPLGAAQEILQALLGAELPVLALPSVYDTCETYEELGVPLGVADGRLRLLDDDAPPAKGEPPAVILAPASARRSIRKRRRARVGLVSGWALIDASIERHRADAGFVLSDHADHDDLMATARATGARRVTTTLGDAAAFASMLRDVGIAALALELPGRADEAGSP